MPNLWNETVEAHRRDVRDAVLDTAADLAAQHGLLGVTMSRIAQDAGIGRATLYKYFPDVETVLHAWHDRQVEAHLRALETVRDRADAAGEQLEAVLRAYALMTFERPRHCELGAFVHRGERIAGRRTELEALVRDLVSVAARSGDVRSDVAPGELARYCLNALAAAGQLRARAGVDRLVAVVLDGLRAGT